MKTIFINDTIKRINELNVKTRKQTTKNKDIIQVYNLMCKPISQGSFKVNKDLLINIHKLIFKKSSPEIAGKYPQYKEKELLEYNQKLESEIRKIKHAKSSTPINIEEKEEILCNIYHLTHSLKLFEYGNIETIEIFCDMIALKHGLTMGNLRDKEKVMKRYLNSLI